jgi:hypothetical protein
MNERAADAVLPILPALTPQAPTKSTSANSESAHQSLAPVLGTPNTPARKRGNRPSSADKAPDLRLGRSQAPTDNVGRPNRAAAQRITPNVTKAPSKLGQAITNSARPSCSEAHRGKGLLALPFLLADTIRDSGCKW